MTDASTPIPGPKESAQGGHDPSSRLAELYRRYRRELVGFVHRKFGPRLADAEDVAQQAFTNFAALPCESDVQNPRAFLYRTAHNIALNQCRREQIGRRFLEAEPRQEERCEARDDFDPEVVLMGRQDYHEIERTIRNMSARRREFLLLNRIDGLSIADIARRAGLSESAVRKHILLAVQECGEAVEQATTPRRRNGKVA